MATTLMELGPQAGFPPSANPALPGRRGVPAVPVIVFDGTAETDTTWYWIGIMPQAYADGAVNVLIHAIAEVAVAGTMRWEVAWADLSDQDFDAIAFAATQSAGATAPGTSGMEVVATVAFTAGAQMDGVAAGKLFCLLVRRDVDGTTGTDDMTGDAQVPMIELQEAA